ncbi:MAG: tRNA pseudouridine(55) synthase TruB [Vampirovibrionales bacterium]|nr:tRNA pseudouridine(55) synthase TruB [Vampirovibrionales bacterium]
MSSSDPSCALPAGVLLIDKPRGMTSHDVIARLRKIYGIKRIGHMGTLDPFATGVLPVALGAHTRLIQYFSDTKRYSARIVFGKGTNTLDCDGIVNQDRPNPPGVTRDALAQACLDYTGTFQQTVPLFSAVKVGGKKLYHYAHAGKVPPMTTLPQKTVTISALSVVNFEPATQENPYPSAEIDVSCSSGTYIRSLARDLGAAMADCPAHLSQLVRTRHGNFELQDAITLDTLAASEHLTQYILNPVSPKNLLGLPVLVLTDELRLQKLMQGQSIAFDPAELRRPDDDSQDSKKTNTQTQVKLYLACDTSLTLMGLLSVRGGVLYPNRILTDFASAQARTC